MRELLGIVMTTYNREEVAKQTLLSLKRNLLYDEGRRFWVIADDGSPDGYVDRLKAVLGDDEPVYVTNALRKGVGVSKNLALKLAFEHTPVVFLTEDDWCLTEPVDARVFYDTLVSNPQVGMIRCGYLSTDISAKLVGFNSMTYLQLDQGSGVYVYSGQCSFRSKVWVEKVGYHKEGVSPGEEELEMCQRYNATKNAPLILWPGNMGFHFQCSPFKNIGMDFSLNATQPEG